MPRKKQQESNPVLASNRKAFHDYAVGEHIEAGIQLCGTEVKSCRERGIQLHEGYVTVESGQAWLRNVHIALYNFGNRFNHEEIHPRRLLLHKKEIHRMASFLAEKGTAVIPLSVYLKEGLIKVELGCCRGKHEYDRRDTIRKNDADREMKRAMAAFNKKNQ